MVVKKRLVSPYTSVCSLLRVEDLGSLDGFPRNFIHAYIRTNVHTYVLTYVHRHTHTHTHIYTYIPWMHKCVTKTVGCGISHKYKNIQNLRCKILQPFYKNIIINHLYT